MNPRDHTQMTRCNEPGCDERADFVTPDGFRCTTHAMQLLARDIVDGNRGWMPIRFSRPDQEAQPTPQHA